MWVKGQVEQLLMLPLPPEILTLIQMHIDNWCGATEKDVYKLICHWLRESRSNRYNQ